MEAIIAITTLILGVLTWAFYKLTATLQPETRK
jgi:hypothetical protein